jgi:hypothetical protein
MFTYVIASRMSIESAICLAPASRRDTFATFPTTLRYFCPLRIRVASGRIVRAKSVKAARSCKPRRMCICKNRALNPVECALTKSLDLKSSRMCTYKKRPGGGAGWPVGPNGRHRCNSFAFTLLSNPHKELPWNHTLVQKVGGGSRPFSDPFVIVRDRAMIEAP